MMKLGWKEIGSIIGMTVMSLILIWIGVEDGSWSTIIFGIFCTAFFGLGGAYAMWRNAPPSPNSKPKLKPLKAPPLGTASQRPRPTLSTEDQTDFDRVFAILCAHGLFAPQVPEPKSLYAAAADEGEPIRPDTPLDALFSASFYDPSFQRDLYDQNLRYHFGKIEQNPDVIAAQITDLAALSDGALVAEDIDIAYGDGGDVTVTFALNKAPRTIRYNGATKYLSTIVLQDVAAAYEALQSPHRFAGVFNDGGLYVTRLQRGGAEALNAALGTKIGEDGHFLWLDDPSTRFEAGGN